MWCRCLFISCYLLWLDADYNSKGLHCIWCWTGTSAGVLPRRSGCQLTSLALALGVSAQRPGEYRTQGQTWGTVLLYASANHCQVIWLETSFQITVQLYILHMYVYPRYRYNVERLCHKLSRVERLIDFRKPIPEAYFPKLDSLVSSRGWPARVSNQTMANINRESDQVKIDIDDLERWRDRIFAAIHSTSVMGVSYTNLLRTIIIILYT